MYWRQLKLVVDRSEITASQQNLKSLLIWSTSYYWENLRGLWTSSEGSGLKEIFSPNCLDWKFDPYLTAGKTQRALDFQEIFSPNCSDWKFDPHLTTGKTQRALDFKKFSARTARIGNLIHILLLGKLRGLWTSRNFQPELLGLEIWSISYYWENLRGLWT